MTGDLNTTFGHRHYLNFAALLYDYAPYHNPEPTTLNPATFIFFPFPYISGIII